VGERFIYPQTKPELVADMDWSGLAGLLDRDPARVDPHRLIVGRRWNASFTRNRWHLKRGTALEKAYECRGRIGERDLAGLGRLKLAR